MSASPADDLTAVLVEAQRMGFLGDRPINEVIDHAQAFVGALHAMHGSVLDLGSGGGIPGFVIAHERPDLELVLVDRRAKRTDHLNRMLRRLGWTNRVTVITADVTDLIGAGDGRYDAVVARSFGPPDDTLRIAASLVSVAGLVVISESPSGHRWHPGTLKELRMERIENEDGRVAVFRSTRDCST